MAKLKSKRVLVIGGNSGIWMAVAAGALAKGADVTIAGRTADRLTRASGVLGNFRAMQLDTSDADGLGALFKTQEAFDHIIVSAARHESGPDFKPFALRDGNLVTGQNPASAEPLAKLVMEALAARLAA